MCLRIHPIDDEPNTFRRRCILYCFCSALYDHRSMSFRAMRWPSRTHARTHARTRSTYPKPVTQPRRERGEERRGEDERESWLSSAGCRYVCIHSQAGSPARSVMMSGLSLIVLGGTYLANGCSEGVALGNDIPGLRMDSPPSIW